MTTTKKLTIAVVALALSLVLVVGGTLAFLVAESNIVTNTFTYGKIELELWENPVENGVFKGDTKETQGLKYENVVPGDVVKKNPTVTVKEGSESCFVYVLVTNNLISTAENATNPVATLHIKDNWVLIGSKDNSMLYRYTTNAQTAGDYNVFEQVTFSNNLTIEDVTALAKIESPIVVKAYAHQAENTTMVVADAAALAWAGIETTN